MKIKLQVKINKYLRLRFNAKLLISNASDFSIGILPVQPLSGLIEKGMACTLEFSDHNRKYGMIKEKYLLNNFLTVDGQFSVKVSSRNMSESRVLLK